MHLFPIGNSPFLYFNLWWMNYSFWLIMFIYFIFFLILEKDIWTWKYSIHRISQYWPKSWATVWALSEPHANISASSYTQDGISQCPCFRHMHISGKFHNQGTNCCLFNFCLIWWQINQIVDWKGGPMFITPYSPNFHWKYKLKLHKRHTSYLVLSLDTTLHHALHSNQLTCATGCKLKKKKKIVSQIN